MMLTSKRSKTKSVGRKGTKGKVYLRSRLKHGRGMKRRKHRPKLKSFGRRSGVRKGFVLRKGTKRVKKPLKTTAVIRSRGVRRSLHDKKMRRVKSSKTRGRRKQNKPKIRVRKGKRTVGKGNRNQRGVRGKFKGKGFGKNKGQPKRGKGKGIARGRLYLRHKKVDKQVRLVWRNGEKTRRITKVGGRKIYRPLKRKFPRGGKLSRVNKQQKQRRREKKIFGFRGLYRSRNHIEVPMLRRRKFYSRRKRVGDFGLGKVATTKANRGRWLARSTPADSRMKALNGVAETPGLKVKRVNRLRASGAMKNATHEPLRVNESVGSVSVLRYPRRKRYRRRSGLSNVRLNVAQQGLTKFESKLHEGRHHAGAQKNRAKVLVGDRFRGGLKS